MTHANKPEDPNFTPLPEGLAPTKDSRAIEIFAATLRALRRNVEQTQLDPAEEPTSTLAKLRNIFRRGT